MQMSNGKFTKSISIIQGMNFCKGCTTSVGTSVNSCKECDNFIAKQLAIDALKAQQKRDNPQPLTLEQLKESVGKPVFVIYKSDYQCFRNLENGWRLVVKVVDYAKFTDMHGRVYAEDTYKYNERWFAYDHEPSTTN